eukprot:TRINITY_DN6720_c0_g1_i1.p1 TRINITY_DN6720_c0_g1~~TRINITY_DN6720_c0_g1_i1.p1  ORF type:complete len:182 (+),score=26.25 TRINITY_DN6720_c0_g1_i1:38-583(+)
MLNALLLGLVAGVSNHVTRSMRVEGFHVFLNIRTQSGCAWDIEERVPGGAIFDTYETARGGVQHVVKDGSGVTALGQYLEFPASKVQGDSFSVLFSNVTASAPLDYSLHSRYPPLGPSPYKVCLNETTARSNNCSHPSVTLPPVCWDLPASDVTYATEVSLTTTVAIWISAALCSVTTYLK